MSVGIRLDPATLGYLSQAMAEAANGMGLAEPFMRRLVQILDGLKSEAEARAPLLSDWFAAGSSSRVGTPPNTHHSAETILVMSWTFEGHRIAVWKNRAEITWKGQPAGTAATPAELRAALDRLAAEPRP